MTDKMIKVEINTEIEAYPVLAINEDTRGVSDFEIPVEMLARLVAACDAVELAEWEIMKYVAGRYEHEAIHEWMDGRTAP